MNDRYEGRALIDLLHWSTLRAQREEALLARREREIRALQQESREALMAQRGRYSRARRVRLARTSSADHGLAHAREEEKAQRAAAREEVALRRLERRRLERDAARRRATERVAALQRLIDKQGLALRQGQRRRDDDASDPA